MGENEEDQGKNMMESIYKKSSLIRICLLPALFFISTATSLIPGAAESDDAEKVFQQMKQAVASVRDYQTEYSRFSAAGGQSNIYSKKSSMAKYLRQPKLYYENVLTVDSNFNDALEPGVQQLYDGEKDIITLFLPGARRLLGEIDIYAESPQLYMFNGENLKQDGLWEWVDTWEKALEKDDLSLETRTEGDKKFSVLTLKFSRQSTSQRYKINQWEIWINQDDRLPWKYKGYAPDSNQPVYVTEYLTLKVNTGFEPDDLEFEGISFWKFPAQFVASTEGLEKIKPEKLQKAEKPAPEFPDLKRNFENSLDAIKDYKATIKVTQKYFRIRGQGTMDFIFKKDPIFYYIYFHDDTRLNIIHPATPGSKLCYDKNKHAYRIIGGGVMRLVGVQELPVADPRYDFAIGESFSQMNLFELKQRMDWYKEHGDTSAEMIMFKGKVMPRAVMKRKGEPLPGQIQDMAIIFDPETWLPVKVEYLGTLDPEGFMYLEYLDIKTNTGITREQYYF
jgi:outer membrane lipoprotein-sorting protein